MNATRTIVFAAVAATLSLATGLAQAEPNSRAAFSVAVMLHTSMRQPQAVAQLCAQDRSMEMPVGATVRVECPAAVAELATGDNTASPNAPRPRPQVQVSF